jgi:hypothetical protein
MEAIWVRIVEETGGSPCKSKRHQVEHGYSKLRASPWSSATLPGLSSKG